MERRQLTLTYVCPLVFVAVVALETIEFRVPANSKGTSRDVERQKELLHIHHGLNLSANQIQQLKDAQTPV